MFEIGFSELLLLAVIAIVVVGPQRLPELAQNFIRFKRKVQDWYFAVNYKVHRELELDKVEQELYDAEVKAHIEQLNQSIMNTTTDPNEYADTGVEPNRKEEKSNDSVS